MITFRLIPVFQTIYYPQPDEMITRSNFHESPIYDFLLNGMAFQTLTKANLSIYRMYITNAIFSCQIYLYSNMQKPVHKAKVSLFHFLTYNSTFPPSKTFYIIWLQADLNHFLITETTKSNMTFIQMCSWVHFILSCTQKCANNFRLSIYETYCTILPVI
jgi:hypothetical protein